MSVKDEESNWDSLASELGLEPAPKAALPESSPVPVEPKPFKPPADEFEPRFEKAGEIIPAHITEIEMKVTAIDDVVESPATDSDLGEDAADVLDDETPESAEEAAGEEPAEGDGKGRRRRRRRRRKKGGSEAVAADAANPVPAEEADDADVLAFPSFEEEEPVEAAEIAAETETETDSDEEEVEEIVPDIALAEEGEGESAEPLPEWKVTAWTDLIATLYRPQDR